MMRSAQRACRAASTKGTFIYIRSAVSLFSLFCLCVSRVKHSVCAKRPLPASPIRSTKMAASKAASTISQTDTLSGVDGKSEHGTLVGAAVTQVADPSTSVDPKSPPAPGKGPPPGIDKSAILTGKKLAVVFSSLLMCVLLIALGTPSAFRVSQTIR